MPLLTRRRAILAKIETTYGTDSVPTGAANAILVRNMSITPQDADLVDRDLVRPYIGRSEQLPAGIRVQAEFEIELAGVATAGQAPGWGPLLRACGFAETLTSVAVTGTAQAGSTSSTIVLAAGASSVNGAYVGMPVRITSGTGSGQTGTITGYVGSSRTATVAANWTVTPDNTSQYSIDPNAVYRPISQNFESVTCYFFVEGVRHRVTGARGTVSIQMTVKEIPVLRFQLTGIYNTVDDSTSPTVDYSAFLTPATVSNINTTALRLHNTACVMSEFSLDMAVAVAHRTLVGGSESVLITDREPAGNITIEAESVATRDWWTIARNATLGAFTCTHGPATSGQRVLVSSGRVQLTTPNYSDMDGIAMLQMGTNFIPSSSGNDELALCVF